MLNNQKPMIPGTVFYLTINQENEASKFNPLELIKEKYSDNQLIQGLLANRKLINILVVREKDLHLEEPVELYDDDAKEWNSRVVVANGLRHTIEWDRETNRVTVIGDRTGIDIELALVVEDLSVSDTTAEPTLKNKIVIMGIGGRIAETDLPDGIIIQQNVAESTFSIRPRLGKSTEIVSWDFFPDPNK